MKFEGLRESMISCSFYVQQRMNELLPENFPTQKLLSQCAIQHCPMEKEFVLFW